MAYSNDEIKQAAQSIVQGRISFRRDSLGGRDAKESYNQLSELVNSALFYEPDSVFYLIYLSSNYYTRSVSAQITLLEEMLDAIDDLLKPNRPIVDVSSLETARQALLGVDNALSRSGVIGPREYQRYTSAIDEAKDVFGRAVKLSYVPRGGSQVVKDIVRPASEARVIIASRLSSIKAGHSNILDAIDSLLSAFNELLLSTLPSKIASRQIGRAVDELSDLSDALNPLSSKARTYYARSSLLKVLTNKSSVKILTERVVPGSPKVAQYGTTDLTYRASVYGNGTAPLVQGSTSSPWPLEAGVSDKLNFDLNGSSGIDVDLKLDDDGYVKGAESAEITSGNRDYFSIREDLVTPYPLKSDSIATGGTYATNGKNLYLVVDGVSLKVPASGTWGSDRTAAQIASDINTDIGTYVDASGETLGGLDFVTITWNNTNSPPAKYGDRFIKISSGVNNAVALEDWYVLWDDPTSVLGSLTRGWDANDELWVQVNDADSPTVVNLTNGLFPDDYRRTAADVAVDIDGTGFDAINTDDPATTGAVKAFSTNKGDSSVITIRSAGLRTSGGRTGYGTPSHLGARTLGFATGQEGRSRDIEARVVANILNNDSTFNAQAQASVIRSTVFTANGALRTASDKLTIYLPDQPSDPSASWDLDKVSLFIAVGANRGIYPMASTSWNSSQKELTITLDGRTLRDNSSTNRHGITIYSEFLKVASNDSSSTGSVKVNNVAQTAHTAIGLATTEVIGTVGSLFVEYNDPVLGWVAADLSRKHIKVGDNILDAVGTEVASITSIANISSGILAVSSVASDLDLSSGFTIQSNAYVKYSSFEALLAAWRSSELPPYEENLDDVDLILNPILNVDIPSRSQVNQAYSVVDDLKDKMSSLKTVLDNFSVPAIAVVTKALRSLQEHGHDRARELLLQSKIADYFGTALSDASYSRAMMSAASTVTVEDLNQTSAKRSEDVDAVDRYVAGWMDEEDPAYHFENESELPDSPLVGFWPGLEEGE